MCMCIYMYTSLCVCAREPFIRSNKKGQIKQEKKCFNNLFQRPNNILNHNLEFKTNTVM